MQTSPFSKWWFIPSAIAVGATIGQEMEFYDSEWSLLDRIPHLIISVAVLFGVFVLLRYWAIKAMRREQQR